MLNGIAILVLPKNNFCLQQNTRKKRAAQVRSSTRKKTMVGGTCYDRGIKVYLFLAIFFSE